MQGDEASASAPAGADVEDLPAEEALQEIDFDDGSCSARDRYQKLY